jgi:17beta-estradiol 17-dehydrogenase / very-long-chain 3-oxoacyl-CoA reductase
LHPRNSGHEPWALVTGASDGIGLATARELLKRRFNVVLHGRNPEKLERVKGMLEGELAKAKESGQSKIMYVAASAAEPEKSVEIIRRFVEEEVEGKMEGKLTVLVNNVGGPTVRLDYSSVLFHPVLHLHLLRPQQSSNS